MTVGVQTGSDLLGVPGWRRRVQQARLAAVVLSVIDLGRKASVTKELVVAGGDISNPSIAWHDGRLLVAVRRPSYRLVGTLLRLAPQRTLESETLLLVVNRSLDVIESSALDTTETTRRLGEARDGLEDPRLFSVGDRLLCLWSGLSLGSKAPSRDHDGMDWDADWSETTNTMVLGEIHGSEVVGARALVSPTSRLREKNWMPFVDAAKVGFVYYVADGSILEMESLVDSSGAVREVAVRPRVRRVLTGWSGSSQTIPWDGSRLGVVHLALRGIPILSRFRPAVYLHRFVRFGPDGQVDGMSRPFRFRRLGVEFCAGAVVDGRDLVLSFGVDDHRAFLMRIPANRVRSMVKPVRRRPRRAARTSTTP